MFSPSYIRGYDVVGSEKFLPLNHMYKIEFHVSGRLVSTNKRLIAYIKVNFYDFDNGVWVLRNE